jgi:signal-transduction protein with cAMP-binding, CBS, and nucleotidyltransferase domain
MAEQRKGPSSAAPGGGFGPGGYGSYGREAPPPGESRRRADFWSPATSAEAAVEPAREEGRARKPLTARDIMDHHVRAAGPETPAAELARMLEERGWGVVPIVDDEGKLVGVVTARDLAAALAAGG